MLDPVPIPGLDFGFQKIEEAWALLRALHSWRDECAWTPPAAWETDLEGLVWFQDPGRRVGEVIWRLQSRGLALGTCGSEHGQAMEDCCFLPQLLPIPGLIFSLL